MKFRIAGKEFKTERGVINFVQRLFPTAHEVFFSKGDILLCRKNWETRECKPVAILRARIRGQITDFPDVPQPI